MRRLSLLAFSQMRWFLLPTAIALLMACTGEGISGSAVGMTNEAAASWCDLAVLTLPYHAHHKVLEELRSALSGKIVIDTTVPIDPDNLSQTRTKSTLSAAEEAAEHQRRRHSPGD